MSKILVVDDDTTLLTFLQDFLRQENYTVIPASNGSEALRLAYREHPDLVVLDVMMPGMDGWEVTARLRELSDVPIILLTAKTSEADKLRGFRLGVDDYMTKPFSFAELSARIQAILARTRAFQKEGRALYTFGDLQVDLDHREVRLSGETVALTPTEFRLLEVLVRRQGYAVSEADLVREVWGAFRQENATAVRRYIWLLRKKVEPNPEEPRYILTVRGYGYRLQAE